MNEGNREGILVYTYNICLKFYHIWFNSVNNNKNKHILLNYTIPEFKILKFNYSYFFNKYKCKPIIILLYI